MPLVLVDREIRTTLGRAWRSCSIPSLFRMLATAATCLSRSEELDEAELERLKDGDAMNSMLADFGRLLPDLKRVLLDERDRYMAAKIFHSGGRRVLAVLGAGHLHGVARALGESVDLVSLERLPSRPARARLLGAGIPLLLFFVLCAVVIREGPPAALETARVFAVSIGLGAALGSALAFCHPLTALTAFFSAPLATLSPVPGAGSAPACVEALLRRPETADFETLGDDLFDLRALWRNRVSRLLLVQLFATAGTTAGGVIGLYLALRGES